MVKSNPCFPKNDVERWKLVQNLVILRFRTHAPHKSSPCYLTLAQISEITKFSKTYIHKQLKHYFENVRALSMNQGIRTRSKSR